MCVFRGSLAAGHEGNTDFQQTHDQVWPPDDEGKTEEPWRDRQKRAAGYVDSQMHPQGDLSGYGKLVIRKQAHYYDRRPYEHR